MNLLSLVNSLFQVYSWLILARVIISWVAPMSNHAAVRFIYDMTEPLLRWLRRYLPPTGGIDFSPLVALIVVQIVQQIVVKFLYRIMF